MTITYGQLKNIARVLDTNNFMILDADNNNKVIIDTTKKLNKRIEHDLNFTKEKNHRQIVDKKFHKSQKAYIVREFNKDNARASFDVLSDKQRGQIARRITRGRIIKKATITNP